MALGRSRSLKAVRQRAQRSYELNPPESWWLSLLQNEHSADRFFGCAFAASIENNSARLPGLHAPCMIATPMAWHCIRLTEPAHTARLDVPDLDVDIPTDVRCDGELLSRQHDNRVGTIHNTGNKP